MATQAIAGYVGKLYISIDGGGVYREIGELRDVTIREHTEMLDATSHSSNGGAEFIPGVQSWDADAAGLYVSADAAQDDVRTALSNRTKCKFRSDPEGTASGKERFSGDGYIEDWELAQPTSDLAAVSLKIRGTGGGFVKSTQA